MRMVSCSELHEAELCLLLARRPDGDCDGTSAAGSQNIPPPRVDMTGTAHIVLSAIPVIVKCSRCSSAYINWIKSPCGMLPWESVARAAGAVSLLGHSRRPNRQYTSANCRISVCVGQVHAHTYSLTHMTANPCSRSHTHALLHTL